MLIEIFSLLGLLNLSTIVSSEGGSSSLQNDQATLYIHYWVLRKHHAEILGVNWKRSAISSDDQRVLHNFTELPRVKLCFAHDLQG